MTFLFLFSLFMKPNHSWEIDLETHGIFSNPLVAVSNTGMVCMADNANGRIHFFDAHGDLFTVLGSKGQGPGKFQQFLSVSWVSSIPGFVLFDQGNGRVVRLSHHGEWVEDMRFSLKYHPRFPILCPSWGTAVYFSKQTPLRAQLTRFDGGDHQVLKTFDAFNDQQSTHIPTPEGQTIKIYYLWDPALYIAQNQKYIVIFASDAKNVFVVDIASHGKPSTVSLPMAPIPLSEADIERAFSSFPKPWHAVKNQIQVPKHWPYACGLFLDELNRIWVVRGTNEPEVTLQGYDFEGDLLGTQHLSGKPVAVQNHAIYLLKRSVEDRLMFKKQVLTLKEN